MLANIKRYNGVASLSKIQDEMNDQKRIFMSSPHDVSANALSFISFFAQRLDLFT